MTDTTGSADPYPKVANGAAEDMREATAERKADEAGGNPKADEAAGEPRADEAAGEPQADEATADGKHKADKKKRSEAPRGNALREAAILIGMFLVLYWLILTFVARPYLIPSESMEPTLHGCTGCVGDRIMVDKLSYRFGSPHPGDVIVFKGPQSWNGSYRSIRSHNTPLRWVQNVLSFVGFVPPDENDLVKRVIAVGGQTVECRTSTGLTVDGKPLNQPFLDPATMMADPAAYPCLGPEFGPVTVPQGRLWVMGDNRTHSADSRAHCGPPADMTRGILCTGDPMAGTVPVGNVIGKARFIAWPPSRWRVVRSVDLQPGG